MSIIDELITNRTEEDLEELRAVVSLIKSNGFNALSEAQKEKYNGGMRGAYTHVDLNRVGNAIKYIAERMSYLQSEIDSYRVEKGISEDNIYKIPYNENDISVSPKTDWKKTDLFWGDADTVYIKDLENIKSIIIIPKDAPEIPESLSKMSFNVANDIEKLLKVVYDEFSFIERDLYNKVDGTVNGVQHSGITYSGE
jgi:hypothetical protein